MKVDLLGLLTFTDTISKHCYLNESWSSWFVDNHWIAISKVAQNHGSAYRNWIKNILSMGMEIFACFHK
jgi:hypothetical protein